VRLIIHVFHLCWIFKTGERFNNNILIDAKEENISFNNKAGDYNLTDKSFMHFNTVIMHLKDLS
jgi:hypothetical protein